jgi:hypothetical protein
MTLTERIAEHETCAVVGCSRHRTPDSLFCTDHLREMWANRLDRQPDGTFVARRRFVARDFTRSVA